MLFIVI